MDYTKYKNYIVKPFPGTAESDDFTLTPTGWKILVDESVSELIEKELGMRYLGGYIWASEYENHRRKVVKLFLVNQSYATFQWGWNFDFIPKPSGKKLMNTRTDKSIYSHLFEVSVDFYRGTKNREKTILSANGNSIAQFEQSITEMAESYRKAFRYVLPTIKHFYNETNTYDKILGNIEKKLNSPNRYFRFINHEMGMVKIFIEYFIGKENLAYENFAQLEFSSEELRALWLSKLKKVQEISIDNSEVR